MADEPQGSADGPKGSADGPKGSADGEPVEPIIPPMSDADAAAQVVAEAEAVVAGADVAGAAAASSPLPPTEVSEEAIVALIAERDEYLEGLQRLKAEFANARRRNAEQASTQRQQAAADLVEKLLPVLDSCDAAIAHGVSEVEPIATALFDVLAAQGLARLDPTGQPFNPEQHEAVMHEDGEGEPTVSETLRTGYIWNDRILRPAMVKVQG